MQRIAIIIGAVALTALLVIFLASGKKSGEDKKSLSLQGILGKVEQAAADGSAGQMLSTIVGKVTGAAMAQAGAAESGAPLVPAQIGASGQSAGASGQSAGAASQSACGKVGTEFNCAQFGGYVTIGDGVFPAGTHIKDTSGMTTVPTGVSSCMSRCNKTSGCQGFQLWASPHNNPNAASCYLQSGNSLQDLSKAKAKSGWAGGLKLTDLPASSSVVPPVVVPPVIGMSPM